MRGSSGIDDYSKSNLVDESGEATEIDISAMTGFGSVRGGAWDGAPAPPNWCVAAATSDAYKTVDQDGTMTFSDLTVGVEYTFEIASTAEIYGHDQRWKLIGSSETAWSVYDGWDDAVKANRTLTLSMQPNASGDIVVYLDLIGGRFTYLAAIKLTWPDPPAGTVLVVE
jgi:hypothetical protein